LLSVSDTSFIYYSPWPASLIPHAPARH
jgi:hypothetical protein